jgi:hypothetical protein
MDRVGCLALLALLVANGCAGHAASGTVGHATPHVPGIRIIKGSQAAGLGVRGEPFELRFGDKQDGTKLVLDFLDQARRSGASHVSDIRIELRSRREGREILCTTELWPFAKQEKEVVPHQQPGRYEQRLVPKLVTTTVTESSYQCNTVTVPVTRTETSYQYHYDYVSKSSRSVPVTRTVTSYESRHECRMVPVTRTVTRYENQLETHYVPPSLTYLAAQYTEFDLMESPPRCRPAPEAGSGGARPPALPHRIAGLVYRTPRGARP